MGGIPMHEKDAKEFVLRTLIRYGKKIAEDLEENTNNMQDEEIIKLQDLFPKFDPSKQYINYPHGFVCVSPSGNLVRLIQPYDSTIYPQPPEELGAQWGFYWSTDPKFSKPFIALSTSPYMEDHCCTFNDHVYRSKIDNNVWEPGTTGNLWEDLGPVENFQ